MKTDSLDLFLSVDSLGFSQVNQRDFMPDLFPFRSPCETVLGNSAACDASILTGSLPAEHGRFARFVYDPQRSPFRWARMLGWLPDSVASNRHLRTLMSRWIAGRNHYDGNFQLMHVPFSDLPQFDCTEKDDINVPHNDRSGQNPVFEYWENSGLPWLRSDWHAPDDTNFDALRDEIERGEIQLAWLSTPWLAGAMQNHSTTSARADAAFAAFEREVRALHSLAQRRYREVRFHLFGNHGITDIHAASNMMGEFRKAGFSFPRGCAVAWDPTMARFWFPGGDAVREQVASWLETRKEGRVLTDEELAAWGCDFPGHRFGELIFLLNNGTMFSPSFATSRPRAAMHGFDPGETDSRASWLSTHPCDQPPGHIADIHSVMRSAADRSCVDFALSARG